MSEREATSADKSNNNGAPVQRQKSQNSGNVYVHKPKRGSNKPGLDRRFKSRSRQFDDNLHKKLAGEEVPKTLRKRNEEEKMPVSPIYLGLFLFLVIGSAFFQILQTSQQGGMVEWAINLLLNEDLAWEIVGIRRKKEIKNVLLSRNISVVVSKNQSIQGFLPL